MNHTQNIHAGARGVGKTSEQIAEEYGISSKTLKKWMKNAGIEIPRGLICPSDQEKIYQQLTFSHQYKVESAVGQNTGEIPAKSRPDDMEHAFALLKNALFCRGTELSATVRDFYIWLQNYLTETETGQFTALDIRKAKLIHQRTLNRYLQELCTFRYIQIAGGNKYREGYQYKISNLNKDNMLNKSLESALKMTLKSIKAENAKKTVGQ